MTVQTRTGGTLVVTVRLTLVPGRDDDLIAAIQAAPHGTLAALIREMMRTGASNANQTETLIEPEPDITGLGMDL